MEFLDQSTEPRDHFLLMMMARIQSLESCMAATTRRVRELHPDTRASVVLKPLDVAFALVLQLGPDVPNVELVEQPPCKDWTGCDWHAKSALRGEVLRSLKAVMLRVVGNYGWVQFEGNCLDPATRQRTLGMRASVDCREVDPHRLAQDVLSALDTVAAASAVLERVISVTVKCNDDDSELTEPDFLWWCDVT